MRKSLVDALSLESAQLLLAALLSVCVFVATPCVSAQEAPSSAELAEAMLRIEGSVKKLRLLAEQTKTVAGVDREALMFRLDQRIIRLLEDAAKLARYVEGLPADAAAFRRSDVCRQIWSSVQYYSLDGERRWCLNSLW